MQGNIIGKILFYFGIAIMIIGVILAYSMANVTNYTGPTGNEETIIQWPIFFNSAIRAVIAGFLVIGLSEIIKLLHSINGKTSLVKETIPTMGATDYDKSDEKQRSEWKLSKADEEKIYEAYSDKAILEIIASSFEGYCIVKLQEYDGPLDPVIKVVDIGGFGIQEVENSATKKDILRWYKEQN